MKPHSELSEIIQKENDEYHKSSSMNGEGGQSRARLSSYDTTEESDADSCVGYVSIQQILREKNSRREARAFLRNMQEDLNRIRDKVVTNKGSLSEAADALTDPRFVPLGDPMPPNSFWTLRLSTWKLLLCAAVVLLLLPLAYFIYLEFSS